MVTLESQIQRRQVLKEEIESLDKEKDKRKKAAEHYDQEIMGMVDAVIIQLLRDASEEVVVYEVDGTTWYRMSMASIRKIVLPRHSGLVLERFTDDASMLTDCKGHRLHTKHSYEGYRSPPHWYIRGYTQFEDVEKAVRHYMEELCEKQYQDAEFDKRKAVYKSRLQE